LTQIQAPVLNMDLFRVLHKNVAGSLVHFPVLNEGIANMHLFPMSHIKAG